MKIIKHGTVTFENKKIIHVEGFEYDGGDFDELEKYILNHYVFIEEDER